MSRLPLFFILLLLCACTDAPQYGRFRSVPVAGWNRRDVQVFDTDTLPPGIYQVSIAVRNSVAHRVPYKAIFLSVAQQWTGRPDTLGAVFQLQHDTLLSFALYDDKGDLQGNGLSLRSHEMPVYTATLTDSAAARITIAHRMRTVLLPGIEAVGVVVKRLTLSNVQ